MALGVALLFHILITFYSLCLSLWQHLQIKTGPSLSLANLYPSTSISTDVSFTSPPTPTSIQEMLNTN